MKFINFYLFEYAIEYLLRYKWKNIFIFVLLSMIVAFMASVFFVADAIKYELNLGVDGMADITLQKKVAGMYAPSDENFSDTLLEIHGVEGVESRVWGYYYFEPKNIQLILVGLDSFEQHYNDRFEKLTNKFDIDDTSIIISKSLKQLFADAYYEKSVHFIQPNGKLKNMDIAGVFDGFTPLEAVNTVVMSKKKVQERF